MLLKEKIIKGNRRILLHPGEVEYIRLEYLACGHSTVLKMESSEFSED